MKTRSNRFTSFSVGALSIALACLGTTAKAQNFHGVSNGIPHNVQQDLQRVRQQLSPTRTVQAQNVIAYPGSPNNANLNPSTGQYFPINGVPGQPIRIPGQQFCPITGNPITGNPIVQPVLPYPQYPVHVTPDRFDGINPVTGGIDTRNEQIDNTYFDPNRESSKYNGTRRWVQRPIYGANGQITGYQEGYVWTNSVTGVEHGELKNVTRNDKGGTHEQIKVQSVPNPTLPTGTHTQIQLRSPSVGR